MLNSKRSEGSLARAAATAMLMILGIGVGLGIGEGFARLTYNTPWYERLLGEQFAKIHPALHHYGLRAQKTSPLKPPDQRRILVLGDSFTYGEGVPDDKAVFPDLLEAGLNRDRPLPGVERYDVLNAGITGSLTRDWLGVWEEVTPEYKPDALLIVFFLRDGTRAGALARFFG